MSQVARVLGIVHVPIAEPIDVSLIALHEQAEGIAITGPSSSDELAVVRRPGSLSHRTDREPRASNHPLRDHRLELLTIALP